MTHDIYRSFQRNINVDPVGDKYLGIVFLRYSGISWGVPGILLATAFWHHHFIKQGNILKVDNLKHFNCWYVK